METTTKIERGHLPTKQHAFNDVAKVAKQSSWTAGCVAVIPLDVSPLYLGQADRAFVFLNREKRSYVRIGESGSPPSLPCIDPFALFFASIFVSFTRPLFYFFFGVVGAFLRLCLRCVVLSQSLCSDIGAHLIGSRSRFVLVEVIQSVLTNFGKVSRPFFRSAFSFSFRGHVRASCMRLNCA